MEKLNLNELDFKITGDEVILAIKKIKALLVTPFISLILSYKHQSFHTTACKWAREAIVLKSSNVKIPLPEIF